MTANKIYRIKTIGEFHRLRQLPKPEHPLISVIDFMQTGLGSNGPVFCTYFCLYFYILGLGFQIFPLATKIQDR